MAVHLFSGTVVDIKAAVAALGAHMNTENLTNHQLMAVTIHYDRDLVDDLNDVDFAICDKVAIDDTCGRNHGRNGIIAWRTYLHSVRLHCNDLNIL